MSTNPEALDTMSAADTGKESTFVGQKGFQTTHWSVVLAAGQEDHPQSPDALERLCQTYWFPIYAYLRRQGHGSHDAQDLTESFFSHLLANQRLQRVHPRKGKFRSFLLASLKNFVANEWDKARALKRGGHIILLSMDEDLLEGRFRREPAHEASPDKAYEQSWAMTLLDSVLEALRKEYAADGKAELLSSLQVYLSGDKGAVPYSEMAARLNLSEGALKMSVLRMRRRFGELLRAEIANTVTSAAEIDEEIRCLFAAVKV